MASRRDVDGQQARQRADARHGILLAEEAVGRRAIANRRSACATAAGCVLRNAHEPAAAAPTRRCAVGVLVRRRARKAREHRGVRPHPAAGRPCSRWHRATRPLGRGTSGNCRYRAPRPAAAAARAAASASSAACSASCIAANSTMPAPPFSVWNARNASSKRSASCGAFSSASKSSRRLLDELARFDQKLLQELVHARHPAEQAAYSTSVSGFNGLTR